MSNGDPTYQELQARLVQAEALLTALRSGEVDAVISHSAVLLLCVQEVEAALREGEARYRSLFEHSGRRHSADRDRRPDLDGQPRCLSSLWADCRRTRSHA